MSINLLIVSALALSSEFKKPLSTLIATSNSATNVALVFTTFFTFSFFISFSLKYEYIIGDVARRVNKDSEEFSRNLKRGLRMFTGF
jgi:hypothetical protein|tara:strand:+ start:437 stop:697 length:261 start_codon:yes stop_codon:yes gene_type:complete